MCEKGNGKNLDMIRRQSASHTPPTARLRLLLVGGFSFASGLQFLLSLAAMLAEEVGDFGLFASDGPV